MCRRIAMQPSTERTGSVCARHCARQIVAFAIGDRSAHTCRQLWVRIPESYRGCASFSDFWEAYQKVLPAETHQ